METIVEHAQGLVYSLLCLMPSVYQKASLNALLRFFLEAQGQPLPQHTQVKSASSLSRFLNHYGWSIRQVIRATCQAVLGQIARHRPHRGVPLRVLIDLTSLPKCGKFFHLDPLDRRPDWAFTAGCYPLLLTCLPIGSLERSQTGHRWIGVKSVPKR